MPNEFFRRSIVGLLTLVTGLAAEAKVRKNPIEIEIDPIAFALKGYSFHLGVPHRHFKLDLGLASASLTPSQTKAILGSEGLRSSFWSYGIKLDWLAGGLGGFHLGVQWDRAKWTHHSVSTTASAVHTIDTMGPRIGYRFGRGHFYVNPWVAFLWVTRGARSVPVGTETYDQKRFQIFPTLHLGLRF